MARLSPADDHFHYGTTDDRSWTETSWFAAQVPERDLCVWTYPLFRSELDVMGCAMYVWDRSGENPFELPYYRLWWHMPFPKDQSPTDFKLSNGLQYELIEPLKKYRVRYDDGEELKLDFVFDGIHPAKGVGVIENGPGHIDQFGHVTGEIELRGERHRIDCIEMRDRTWSPRRESRQGAYVSYSYGASGADSGFQLSKRYSRRRASFEFLGGFVLTPEGEIEAKAGDVEVSRDRDGRPLAVQLEIERADGKTYKAQGEVISRLAMPPTPTWFAWACTVKWTLDDGSIAYGEHQDTWGLQVLRAARRGEIDLEFFKRPR